MERQTVIRGELQRLGVAKADLAFKAVPDLTFAGRGWPDYGEAGEGGAGDAGLSVEVCGGESRTAAGTNQRRVGSDTARQSTAGGGIDSSGSGQA